MRKLIVWLALFLLVFVPLEAKLNIPYKSIQPIQGVNDDGVLVNGCTSFSINEARHLWATAAHCNHEGQTTPTKDKVFYIYSNTDNDVAVYSANPAPALHLAPHQPEVGDPVMLIGYPYGTADPLVAFGRVSASRARLTQDYTGDVYDMIALPGNSGGPILDNSNRVVGIAQRTQGPGLAYGTPYREVIDALKEFAESY